MRNIEIKNLEINISGIHQDIVKKSLQNFDKSLSDDILNYIQSKTQKNNIDGNILVQQNISPIILRQKLTNTISEIILNHNQGEKT